jgi:starch phosphorylase
LDGDYRDRIEAEDLLDILEREVIPAYYRRDPSGRPQDWIERSKRSMWSVLPRFNACRMVFDYLRRFYLPAIQQSRALLGGDAEGARALAAWKAKIKTHWPQVSLRWTAAPPTRIRTGEAVSLVVAANLGGLDSGDVSMECLVEPDRQADGNEKASFSFTPGDMQGPEMLFRLDLQPPVNGLLRLSVRMFPVHPLLAHRFETGCMVWL